MSGKVLHRKGCQASEQAAQGNGGVTISGGIKRCVGATLGDMV